MKEKACSIVRAVFLGMTVLLFAFPILWIGMLSLKTDTEIFANPMALPSPPQWQNYPNAFETMDFWTLFGNTMVITVCSVTVGLGMVILGAFAITRMWFGSGRLQNAFYKYFVLGMLVPGFILLFPIYIINAKLGTINSLWGVIIPYWGWAAPMNLMIIAAAFKAIPRELDEAAAIDGCGSFRILTMVDLPILKSALATCLIICILGCWNEYPLSSIMLMSSDKWTLSLAASKFKGLYTSSYSGIAAAIMILTVPQIIIFTIFQKQIEEGVVAGAVKG